MDKAARDIRVNTLVIRRWQGFREEVCGGFCISLPQSAAGTVGGINPAIKWVFLHASASHTGADAPRSRQCAVLLRPQASQKSTELGF